MKEQDAATRRVTGLTAAESWRRHAEGVHWNDTTPRDGTVPQGATKASKPGGRSNEEWSEEKG